MRASSAGRHARSSTRHGSQGRPHRTAATQPLGSRSPDGSGARLSSRRHSRAFDQASTTDAAFLERLVMFWSNHFCVSANKGPVRGIAGAYEREAIRPYVLGRFADMLLAVEQHPAMLIYLDNAQSIGPNSRAGAQSRPGPEREPGARDPGIAHAGRRRRLHARRTSPTSRAFSPAGRSATSPTPLSEPGKFFFAPARHEPGDRTVLGKRYPDRGQSSGRGGAARSGGPPGHGAPHRPQARAALRGGRSHRRTLVAPARDDLSRHRRDWRPSPGRW